jgi:hypothetical protein
LTTSFPGEAEERARKQKRAKKRDRALIMSFRRTGDSFKHWSEKHNTSHQWAAWAFIITKLITRLSSQQGNQFWLNSFLQPSDKRSTKKGDLLKHWYYLAQG